MKPASFSPSDSSAPTDVIDTLIGWLDQGHAVALATVISTWGSSPCPAGSHLAIRSDGAIIGSVSAGCVEAAVIHEAMEVLEGAPLQVLEYGVTGEMAWQVGLACGGEIRVLVRRVDENAALYREARKRAEQGLSSALVTRIVDGALGLIGEGIQSGPLDTPQGLSEAAFEAIRENRNHVFEIDEAAYFIESITPPNRLILIGAVHIAQALVPMARIAGFKVVVLDPRETFATPERFPGVEIHTEWPDQALKQLRPNDQTAIVVLTHDPKIDDAVLHLALTSPAFYVGALGSLRTQEKRNIRLADLGLSADDLDRLHGPVGLDIGSASPAEIAVSILAEIIQEMRRG
ncbi:MAG: XdhC family protein [Rhodospirillales bacterium]|nr:XdhC family protein [Rhodospirillales bacterium]